MHLLYLIIKNVPTVDQNYDKNYTNVTIPVVTLSLSTPSGHLSLNFLIDTGSQFSRIDRNLIKKIRKKLFSSAL